MGHTSKKENTRHLKKEGAQHIHTMAPTPETLASTVKLARSAALAAAPLAARHLMETSALHKRERPPGSLSVTDTQKVTLGVIAAYTVAIAILWNVPFLRWSLWPFKMLVIAFHEFGHASTACCTGGRVESIKLDPREGGVTMMRGGISAITLPAGYLGSSLIGALLIFCGFDIIASKVVSFVLAVCFLLTLWWGKKDWLTIFTVLLAVGLLVACWFIAHAQALRFFVLFIGVMSSLYSVWDIVSFPSFPPLRSRFTPSLNPQHMTNQCSLG